ncbi:MULTISPECIES: hypothetical protein [unclassified Streptomyces]|uniref:hypothetical protein n=1 Tax=unclassified Streptomyces TaxID=2593676 RepID=UPI0004BE1038|nr:MULTISPECIES: hypothetical protein [unclassified Streptomyces]
MAGPAAGLLIAIVTAPVGMSGAVFLLPVHLSVFGVPSPAITPKNSTDRSRPTLVAGSVSAARAGAGRVRNTMFTNSRSSWGRTRPGPRRWGE